MHPLLSDGLSQLRWSARAYPACLPCVVRTTNCTQSSRNRVPTEALPERRAAVHVHILQVWQGGRLAWCYACDGDRSIPGCESRGGGSPPTSTGESTCRAHGAAPTVNRGQVGWQGAGKTLTGGQGTDCTSAHARRKTTSYPVPAPGKGERACLRVRHVHPWRDSGAAQQLMTRGPGDPVHVIRRQYT